MKSATASRPAAQRRVRRAAALYRQGDAWRLIVGEANGRMRIIASQTIPPDNVGAVRSVLAAHRVERLVRVLPAAACIARLIEIDDADDEQLLDALALQAEAQLPASIPAHRRGWGALPARPGAAKRPALLTGWMNDADEPDIPGVETVWTGEAVALAEMLRAAPGAVCHANPEDGAVCIVALDGDRAAIRTLRESGDDEARWNECVRTAVDETARILGRPASDEFIRRNGSTHALRLEPDARAGLLARCEGATDDAEWLEKYAIPLAALIAWFDAPDAARPLLDLHRDPPAVRGNGVQRVLTALESPKRAWTVVVICTLIVLLSPLVVAFARDAVLAAKASGLEDADEAQAILDQRVSLQRELEKRRWPMTQILAHLAGAMPLELTVEEVRLDAGQRFIVEGSAPSDEIVNQFQANLNRVPLFGPVTIEQAEPDDEGRGIRFEVKGAVVAPYAYRTADYVEDFTEQTLAVRLYGEETSGYLAAGEDAPGATAASDDGDARSDNLRRDRADRRPERLAESPESRRAGSDAPIPPPITDAELEAVSSKAALFPIYKKYLDAKAREDLDAPTRQRVEADIEKIKARLAEL